MRFGRDALLAAALAVVGQLDIWVAGNIEGPAAITVPASLLLATAVGFRRRAPLVALALGLVALAAQDLLAEPAEGLSTILAIIVLSYSVAAELPPALASVAGATLLGAVWAAVALGAPAEAGDYAFTGLIVAIPWLIGIASRRAERDREIRVERAREQHTAEAVTRERARIARELHDVVAHGVSVMVVHAGALRQSLDADRPEAAGLAAIEHSGREALAELRVMLRVLRAEDAAGGLAPQPGIDDLEQLAERLREAGVAVELAIDATAAPGAGLAAYRIVQEALTNVLKHGRDVTRVSVRVARTGELLELAVVDDGALPGPPGGGYGLIGMRERAAAYSGELTAGPGPEGGWRVAATLHAPPG